MIRKLLFICAMTLLFLPGFAADENSLRDAPPPNGLSLEENWSMADAWRRTTSTREIVSLNGLWQFYPVLTAETARRMPAEHSGWGFFKVPGIWPGMGKKKNQPGDSTMVYGLDAKRFPGGNPAALVSAWYRRTITIPDGWRNRRILLEITMLQTAGRIFVDGKPAGDLYFPGGKIDLTRFVTPGGKHELAILVSAVAAGSGDSVFMAPDRQHKEAKSISNRGITGDVYLHAEPLHAAITDVHVLTSFRRKRITFDTGLSGNGGDYTLEADILWNNEVVKQVKSERFRIPSGGRPFRIQFSADWLAEHLWDTDTPENLYTANLRLKAADGATLDAFLPQQFGFREFWIDGRNFMLNGSVIHLRSLCSSAMRDGADHSSAAATRRYAERAKKNGFNHLIAYNYFFTPGMVGYQDDFYLQSSRAGVLTSLTLPHIKDFEWYLKKNEQRYRKMAEFLIRRFQNVPGVVLYAVNHNATGYYGDQNPQKIDGVYAPDPFMKKANAVDYRNRRQALLSAKLIQQLDPSRPVYHHESGNLGDIFSINCYLNWVPAQERSDWFEHWERSGVKPLMLVEWGNPHIASWSSYRGPDFIWRVRSVQCMWFNEYNAAILGEKAYRSSRLKEIRYRRQSRLCAGNRPVQYGEIGGFSANEDGDEVIAAMIGKNYRDMRARGVSAILPWDQGKFWRCRNEVDEQLHPDRFRNLKQPGIVPDRTRRGGGYPADGYGSYAVSRVGEAGLPYLRELIAWIGGKPGDVTEQSHTFRPGETVEKTIVILNDSRRTRNAKVRWRVPALGLEEQEEVSLMPGTRRDLPVTFPIPESCRERSFPIEATVRFDNGEERSDRLGIDLVASAPPLRLQSRVGLYDPREQSEAALRRLGVPFRSVKSDADLEEVDLLVVGRQALPGCPLPLAEKMRRGGRLLVLEQDSAGLAELGFRSNEYGIRTVFPLVADFTAKPARDWRGASTLTPPELALPGWERQDPVWNWQGFSNTRAWRAGNRGNVCSVPLEKPVIGDFLPLMQCGFDLQYTPAVEWRSGNGIAIFSQFDLSDRTQNEPEADELLRRLLCRLDSARVQPDRPTWFSGGEKAAQLLEDLGVAFQPCVTIPESGVLVVSSGTGLGDLTGAVKQGLNVFALALSQEELNHLFPGRFETKVEKRFSDFVGDLGAVPEFRGISNADLHCRMELEFAGFTGRSNGGTALQALRLGKGSVVVLQVAPWMMNETDFQYRTSRRRNHFLISRLLRNLGAADRFDAWGKLDREHRRRLERERGVAFSGRWKSSETASGEKRVEEHSNTFHVAPEVLRRSSDAILAVSSPSRSLAVEVNGRKIPERTINIAGSKRGLSRRFVVPAALLHPEKNVVKISQEKRKYPGDLPSTVTLSMVPENRFYPDIPIASDDPYRYYRW